MTTLFDLYTRLADNPPDPPKPAVSAPRPFAESLKLLRGFIGGSQLQCIRQLVRGEEKDFFIAKMDELATLIAGMPVTYQQDGLGDQAVAHLHYFIGGCDWYITEKDKGSPDDAPDELQNQAFGLADLGYGGELGYISIAELLANNVELDLHWRPKTIAEIQAKRSE